ncbi:hypothetical protein COU59_02170 [Candidatus Pacearchaeota archaeon CG10_big_fil_rev_8_21_14_0_10_34_12]|nr:MAG: hypothetical protein COU59_02170 [Candidatus Pacearchaeota archaeon CG10_big_fil_rev_8_21_14_0_10_34_12]
MVEKEVVYSSKTKIKGIFSFEEYYKFCYKWLTEDLGLDVMETKYSEKIVGESKNIEVKWLGTRDVTDYFKFEVNVDFMVIGLKKAEIINEGVKIETNTGSVETKVKGTLAMDYKGKFEKDAFRKFLRGIYEKWVVPSLIDQQKVKLIEDCDEFLNQGKAFLDLEAKKG